MLHLLAILTLVATFTAETSASPLLNSIAESNLEKRAKNTHCEFILCSGNGWEQMGLTAGTMDATLGPDINKDAKKAWNSCTDERSAPRASPGHNWACKHDALAFSWEARASTCHSGAGCTDFPIGSDWDLAALSDPRHSPSKSVFAHIKGTPLR